MFDFDTVQESTSPTDELEEVVMNLIINAYTALKQAKQGDFDGAKTLMEQSRLALNEAHRVQTKLIESDLGEGRVKLSLVLVHAQDHLMTSMLARELVVELIELHEKLH